MKPECSTVKEKTSVIYFYEWVAEHKQGNDSKWGGGHCLVLQAI